MKRIYKYALSAFASVALSLTLAGVVAAQCTIDVQEEYTCYVTGQDENYCYYQCYCKTGWETCRRALEREGHEILN